ncbi:hypothetical protein ACFV3R_03925 [Streptomyces sp. NPDC059740]|uniref:hypothetical protein n=1 Tax=Streptomyces sp. NPDC059740 TaxID=3346926 RepID=UPI00364D0B8A
MAHWHAYAWIGTGVPADPERLDPSQPVPPRLVADWLRKDASRVVHTYRSSEEGRAAAGRWLRAELEEHPRGAGDLPAQVQLAHAEDCLRRGTDVVWGYWSHGRFVSRALVACPRQAAACPYGA